jgi:small redox-active disulfide protein 2
MNIQILGIACPECDTVLKNTWEALAQLEIDVDIEMIDDPGTIKSLGVYVTPALLIDGVVKIAGQVPSTEQIKQYITESDEN